MMEHTTDRLFWTLSSIIIAALLLTIGVKVFPKAASEVIHPMSGIVQQADTVTQATKNATENATNSTDGSTIGNNSSWTVNPPTVTNNTSANTNVSADQFNALADLVNSLKDQVSTDKFNIAQLNTNLNQADGKNEQLNNKLNDTLNDIQTKNNNASSDMINKIKSNNTELYNQISSMNQNYQTQGQQYENQINLIKQQIADTQKAQDKTNQNATNNSNVSAQLAQQLSTAQDALKQLANAVSANNTQAQNIYSQYENQIQQLNTNVTDAQNNAASAQNTANNASNKASSNATNIAANSQAAANAQNTANSASNSANNAQTTANNAINAINNVFQSRSHVFTNNESLYDAFGMQDGYYSVGASTSEAPSNFSGTGVLSIYNVNGQTYLVLVDSNGNNTWTANATTSNPSMSWSGWTQQAKESDVSNNTNLITSLQNQINTLNQNAFQYRTMPADGTSLRNVTQPGIYVLSGGNHNWTDWPDGESNDSNRSWFHILVVTSAQAASNDPTLIPNEGIPNVVHQQLITGGYSWDPSESWERTFHQGSTNGQSANSQYDWVKEGAGLNDQSSQITVNDMNQLKTPGIYNFSGNGSNIANLPPTYSNPSFDTILVYKGSDTITQLIIGTQGSYAREIGDTNPWTNPWQQIGSTPTNAWHPWASSMDALLNSNDGTYSVTHDTQEMPYGINGIITKATNNGGADAFFTLYDMDQNRYFVNAHNWAGWHGWHELSN